MNESLQNFVCKLCEFKTESKEEILDHITEIHPEHKEKIMIKAEKDYTADSEPEENVSDIETADSKETYQEFSHIPQFKSK